MIFQVLVREWRLGSEFEVDWTRIGRMARF
ncbi:unnamed protein product [Linum tenue]|uniref:Uncharacterized protein n=1 Tax=Linum tenue TaxID=586396 RepID=A0AAV0L7D8_9ROSI|nr:unnamed protein product [Linum tenue]